MKKLDDLPRRVDYQVPEDYFDNLPARIQSRIPLGKRPSWRFNPGLSMRYALPLLALLVLGVFWYDRSNESVYEQLNRIDEHQLSWFLEDPDLTSEELAANVMWSTEDLDALEGEVFNAIDASGQGLDVSIDELDLENF